MNLGHKLGTTSLVWPYSGFCLFLNLNYHFKNCKISAQEQHFLASLGRAGSSSSSGAEQQPPSGSWTCAFQFATVPTRPALAPSCPVKCQWTSGYDGLVLLFLFQYKIPPVPMTTGSG